MASSSQTQEDTTRRPSTTLGGEGKRKHAEIAKKTRDALKKLKNNRESFIGLGTEATRRRKNIIAETNDNFRHIKRARELCGDAGVVKAIAECANETVKQAAALDWSLDEFREKLVRQFGRARGGGGAGGRRNLLKELGENVAHFFPSAPRAEMCFFGGLKETEPRAARSRKLNRSREQVVEQRKQRKKKKGDTKEDDEQDDDDFPELNEGKPVDLFDLCVDGDLLTSDPKDQKVVFTKMVERMYHVSRGVKQGNLSLALDKSTHSPTVKKLVSEKGHKPQGDAHQYIHSISTKDAQEIFQRMLERKRTGKR
eukprot:g1077.t1